MSVFEFLTKVQRFQVDYMDSINIVISTNFDKILICMSIPEKQKVWNIDKSDNLNNELLEICQFIEFYRCLNSKM